MLKNSKTCPEETIFQIGTIEESVSPETLVLVVGEFYEEFEKRFGFHVHILDWALHLDEGTPHIHERHVFDCENKYGELCPQQEKALEALGVPLPNPDKPKGRKSKLREAMKNMQLVPEEVLSKAEEEPVQPAVHYTTEEWLRTWFEVYSKPNIREATQDQYNNFLEKHVIPNVGDIPLEKLTRPQ